MTPEALIARFEHEVAHAERTLGEEGTVYPLFAVVDAQGRTRPVSVDFSSEDTKEVSFAIVRLICVADAAVAVFHRVEAWLESDDMAPDLSASQGERRVEVLLVFGVARVDGAIKQMVRAREIKRDLVGTLSGLYDVAMTGLGGAGLQATDLQGRMTDLIPAEPPTFAERRRARDMVDRIAKRLSRGQAALAG